jgi:hypothetical protein
MLHYWEKRSMLWRIRILWLVVALLIFPQMGFAEDAVEEYVTIPTVMIDLSEVDPLYESSSAQGFQVDSAHPCFSDIDGVLFSKDQKTLIRYPYMRAIHEYVIPSGTITIEDDAFLFADNLQKITLSATVNDCLEALQSESTCLEDIEVVPGNLLYSSVEGVLYTKDQKELLCYPRGRKGQHFSITEGTEVVGEAAFLYCYFLTSISMPDTVYMIRDSAFGGMNNLKKVDLSSGLRTIEFAAFATSTKLQELTLPEGLTYIGERAFMQTRLTSIHIPKTVNYIGYDAFGACDLLESVYFENRNVNIEDEAFSHFFAPGAKETFGWDGDPIDLTMYAYPDSTAEKYALENGFSLLYLSNR